MSLASDIYSALYDLATAALADEFAQVPVIQDQQSEAAPTRGTYLAIAGTQSLDRQGTPDIGLQDANDERHLDQLHTGEVVLWEVNGDGSKLQAVFDFSETEAGQEALGAYGVSILDYGMILDAAIKLDNRWIPQARASLIVSAKSRVSETLSTINTVQWANAENPTNSGSIEYPTA
jgi:hypothetical protein